MIEVFLRMDVILSKTAPGAPVDKKTHRIVSFEPAATEDEDGLVARSMRPGFFWRERPIRAEEIIARRWKAPARDSGPLPDAERHPVRSPDLFARSSLSNPKTSRPSASVPLRSIQPVIP